jgi:hypothetical protein
MARFNRGRFRRKLNAILEQAEDEAFQILIWAVHRLQAGDVALARRFLDFPPQVVEGRLGDPQFIPPWELETLLNERLALPPLQLRPDARNRVMNCRTFSAVATTVNLLRRLENSEIGVVLRRMNVMREMPRLGHRQFEWQRGFWNTELLYRWSFLFGGPLCRSYFEQKTGVCISDFILYGACIHSLFEREPGWMERQLLELPLFGGRIAEPALRLLSAPIEVARQNARRLRRGGWTTSYQPSQYRQTPLILIGDPPRLRAPLPDLIQIRITSGLFYDVADAPQRVHNEVSDRFEDYTRDLLAGALPSLQASRSVPYRFNGNPMNSPDVLLQDRGRLAVVFECKARKMSFAARYAEDPVADGGGGFDELIKGICQIWRFFAHIRLECVADIVVDQATGGVLLTLDNWSTMSAELQRELIDLARERVVKRYPEVTPADQRPLVFCSIEELEQTLAGADEAQFLTDLKLAVEDRYAGWILPNVHRDATGEKQLSRPYPFAGRLGEVLPWWDDIDSLAEAIVANAQD